MLKLLAAQTTLAEANDIAEELGLASGYVLDRMHCRRMRREAKGILE